MEDAMKRILKSLFSLMLVAALLFCCLPQRTSAATYTVPNNTVRVGLAYGDSTVASASLKNVNGGGFRFGYYTEDRVFHLLGNTETGSISVILDKNMYYASASDGYVQGIGSGVQVGCVHIQLDKAYTSFSKAQEAADSYSWAGGFVKYAEGYYWVCVGNYVSSADAENALSWMELNSPYWVTSGTSYTVTVVATGTSKILFEYDVGAGTALAVTPSDSSQQMKWQNNYYTGGFQFQRVTGAGMNIVTFVELETYIKGVIPYEMGDYFPLETLKAQAICARNFVVAYQHKHEAYGFDVCNTIDCQLYRGTLGATAKTDQAVDETRGQIMVYNGKVCETMYHSSNGGATESCVNVWTADLPYLTGRVDEYESIMIPKITNYYWSRTYTAQELTELMQSKGYNNGNIVSFYVSRYTEVGNVYSITLVDESGRSWTFSKNAARTKLGFGSLKYTITTTVDDAVYVNDNEHTVSTASASVIGNGRVVGGLTGASNGRISALTGTGQQEVGSSDTYNPNRVFTVTGYGHGHNVGFGQWGAYAMAYYYGKDYVEMLKYYFTGVDIITMDTGITVSGEPAAEPPAASGTDSDNQSGSSGDAPSQGVPDPSEYQNNGRPAGGLFGFRR